MDVQNLTSGFTHSLSNTPFNTLFTNPIYVSLLIVIIIMLVVICTAGQHAKTSFYALCSTLAIVFIHNKLLLIDHASRLSSADSAALVDSMPLIGGVDLEYLTT